MRLCSRPMTKTNESCSWMPTKYLFDEKFSAQSLFPGNLCGAFSCILSLRFMTSAPSTDEGQEMRLKVPVSGPCVVILLLTANKPWWTFDSLTMSLSFLVTFLVCPQTPASTLDNSIQPTTASNVTSQRIFNNLYILICRFMTRFWGSTHHPVQDFAKNHVLPVQPRCFGSQDEELRPVGVRTGVRHAHLVHEHT